jgi:hypothetical protein
VLEISQQVFQAQLDDTYLRAVVVRIVELF